MKFENFDYLNVTFISYYHVEMNADLGRPQALANVQKN